MAHADNGVGNGEDSRVAAMLGRKLWVVVTRAVAPRNALMKNLAAHLTYQIQLEKTGVLFSAGPLKRAGSSEPPGQTGLIILRAANELEARQLADADPMHASGVRSYELFEWTMNEGRIGISFDLSDQRCKLE